MRHVFLINPNAGKAGVAHKAAQKIRESCEKLGLDFEIVTTASPQDAKVRVRAYGHSGEEARVYACGGDGTLNQIVQAAAGHDNLAVTNLPMGTGNDFLKMFGVDNVDAFWDIAALTQGPQAPLDLIDCNGVLALNTACAGVDARVAKDVHRYPSRWGKGAYVMSLLKNVALHPIARPMKAAMDGKHWDEPISLVCVCNGRYYGGGFMPVGDAMPDDGILDVLLVTKVGRLGFVRLVGDYSNGRYAKHPHVVKDYHGPGPVTLEAVEPITMCLDGEVLEDTRFTLSLSEKKLNFFWPIGLRLAGKGAPELVTVGK